ncbi:MAG: LysM peptidoglycan-binding domain-containing protein [Pseudomonadota bacterium]|nr:LysM peptidoglycan-binding domain-containing protein [Pseudomonadota bacterium]
MSIPVQNARTLAPSPPPPTPTVGTAGSALATRPQNGNLTIPSATQGLELQYEVRPGDTLSDIARRYGVSLNDLLQANPQFDPNSVGNGIDFGRGEPGTWDADAILPGDKINVPGTGMKPLPQPTPTPPPIFQPPPRIPPPPGLQPPPIREPLPTLTPLPELKPLPVPQPQPTSSPTPPTSAPVPASGPDSIKVDQALSDIRDRMRSGFFNPVGADDVKAVQDIVGGLSKQDANAVMKQLSDDELRNLVNEVNDGSLIGGGLNKQDKTAFFDTMAKQLDGEQLARLSQAFDRSQQGRGVGKLDSADDVAALGSAVGRNASTQTKLDYIKAMSANGALADQKSVDGYFFFGGSMSQRSDPQARAVAEVIASMGGSPTAANRALEALTPDERAAVVKAAADPVTYASRGSVTSSYDTTTFQKLMEVTGKTHNADLKARVFADAASVLKEAESGNLFAPVMADTAAMRQGMHSLLMSDVNGVVGELASNAETRNGTALAIYAKSALEAKEFDQLADVQVRLSLGNDLKGDPVQTFGAATHAPDGSDRYLNAERLGYFAGAMNAATRSISGDAAQQAELTTAVLKSGLTLIDKAAPKPVGVGASVAKEWVGLAVKAAYEEAIKPQIQAEDKMFWAMQPVTPGEMLPNGELDREVANGTAPRSAFEDTWSMVSQRAKP